MAKHDLSRISAELERYDRDAIRSLGIRESELTEDHLAAVGDHRRALVAALSNKIDRVGFVLPKGISRGVDEDGDDLPPVISVNRDIRCEKGWLATCGLLTPLGSAIAKQLRADEPA